MTEKDFEQRFKMRLIIHIFGFVLSIASRLIVADILKGHLEPFGQQSELPLLQVDEVNGYVEPKYFFNNYVLKNNPLIMRGAAKTSLAWNKWTDDYFKKAAPPSPEGDIFIEYKKKENRLGNGEMIHMAKFIEIYNSSDIYMVHDVPDWIKSDVTVPGVLQCPEFTAGGLDSTVMWFSSGGTSSVVHHDSLENINCVLRGTKTLIFVNSTHYREFLPHIITKEDGAYNDKIDVDRIDVEKYPIFSKINYHIAHIYPGDCLYIPYLWVHQVRSFNDSNLAVNVWWPKYVSPKVNWSLCNQKMDPNFTMDKIIFVNKAKIYSKIEMLSIFRMQLKVELKKHELNLNNFIEFSTDGCSKIKTNHVASTALSKMFETLDKDKNGFIDENDLSSKSEKNLYLAKVLQFGQQFDNAMQREIYADEECKGLYFFKLNKFENRKNVVDESKNYKKTVSESSQHNEL